MPQTFPLATVFLAALEPARAEAATDALEQVLETALASARAAWPGVDVDERAFGARLGALVGDAPSLASAIAGLHAGDLYLATALLAGDAAALAAFDRAVLVPAVATLSGVPASAADEVRQRLRERLLVSGPGAPARIGSYRAKGPLGGWVRVAAARLVVDLQRQADGAVPLDESRAVATASPDPELGYLKRVYADEFRTAIRSTLDALPVTDRNMMRLYFFEGMTHRAIGALLDVHETTVLRRLARCRQDILDGTRRLLQERLRIAPEELDSILGLLDGELSASFSPLLRRDA